MQMQTTFITNMDKSLQNLHFDMLFSKNETMAIRGKEILEQLMQQGRKGRDFQTPQIKVALRVVLIFLSL